MAVKKLHHLIHAAMALMMVAEMNGLHAAIPYNAIILIKGKNTICDGTDCQDAAIGFLLQILTALPVST